MGHRRQQGTRCQTLTSAECHQRHLPGGGGKTGHFAIEKLTGAPRGSAGCQAGDANAASTNDREIGYFALGLAGAGAIGGVAAVSRGDIIGTSQMTGLLARCSKSTESGPPPVPELRTQILRMHDQG